MKKKLFTLTMAGALSVSTITAFAAPTAQEIFENENNTENSYTSADCTVTGTADITFPVDETNTMDASGDFTMDMQMTMDPLAYHMPITMNYNVLGMTGSQDIEMYGVTEDGEFVAYVQALDEEGNPQWQKTSQEMPTFDMAQIQSMSTEIMSSISSDFYDKFTVSEGDGTYTLDADFTASEFITLADQLQDAMIEKGAMKAEDKQDLSSLISEDYAPIMDAVVISLSETIDSTSYEPKEMTLSLENSDFATLAPIIYASILGDEASSVTDTMLEKLDVRALNMKYVFNSYDTVDAITVPADVIASAVEVDTSTLTDAASELESSVATDTEADAIEEVETESAAE